MSKNEIKDNLIKIDEWFKVTKEKWMTEQSISDSSQEFWKHQIILWIEKSNFFSKDFCENLHNIETLNDFHFGNFFWDFQELGGMLKGLCNENHKLIIKELYKESTNKFRYITRFENVLNSMPDSNADERYMWKYDEGDNGEIWQFSIVFVKENDEWKIDKFERYWAKFLEEDR